MTTPRNKSFLRLESDIEKNRAEANWERVKDLTEQLRSCPTKPTDCELIIKLYLCECKIERFLTDHPLTHKNKLSSYSLLARTQLKNTKDDLEHVAENFKKPELLLQCHLLLTKLTYIQEEYSKALKLYDELCLEELTLETSEISGRTLLLVAEAYAIKGFCLEYQPPATTSKLRLTEHWQQVVHYLEKGTEIGLLYLQDQDRHFSSVTLTNQQNAVAVEGGLNSILYGAMQQSPIILMRNGNLLRAIGSYRKYLSSVECYSSYHIRQTLCRQLAEILLRGISEKSYEERYNYNATSNLIETSGTGMSDVLHHNGVMCDDGGEGGEESHMLMLSQSAAHLTITSGTSQDVAVMLKPVNYNRSMKGVLVPHKLTEEIVLLLLISESLANRDAVLSRFTEEEERRVKSIENVTAIYDLLTIALVRKGQFDQLRECFERAVRFSYNCFHIWYQFALSLVCQGHYQHALGVLEVCAALDEGNATIMLLAAKICYNHLGNISEGIRWSDRCLSHCPPGRLEARANLSAGVGCLLQASQANLLSERLMWSRKAQKYFHTALSIDGDDDLVLYYMALQYAITNQLSEALVRAYEAVEVSEGHHVPSIQLLALLLTATERWEDALETIECALIEDEDDISSWHIKMKIEKNVYNSCQRAITTCKQLLLLWQKQYEKELERCRSSLTDLDDLSLSGTTESVLGSASTAGPLAIPPSISVADMGLADGNTDTVSMTVSSALGMSPGMVSGAGSVRLEQQHTLSDTTSTTSRASHLTRLTPQLIWNQYAQIWVELFDMYLSCDELEDAENCFSGMYQLYSVSGQTSYMQGRLQEYKGDYQQAVVFYRIGLSLNQDDVLILVRLAGVYLHLEQLSNAERLLKAAVRLAPQYGEAWKLLGTVYEKWSEHDLSSQCLRTATQTQAAAPVLSYNILPKIVF